jgi:hypothetical protein
MDRILEGSGHHLFEGISQNLLAEMNGNSENPQ